MTSSIVTAFTCTTQQGNLDLQVNGTLNKGREVLDWLLEWTWTSYNFSGRCIAKTKHVVCMTSLLSKDIRQLELQVPFFFLTSSTSRLCMADQPPFPLTWQRPPQNSHWWPVSHPWSPPCPGTAHGWSHTWTGMPISWEGYLTNETTNPDKHTFCHYSRFSWTIPRGCSQYVLTFAERTTFPKNLILNLTPL